MISQEQLANHLGIHGQSLSNIERGIAGIPAKHAPKLSKALGIELEDVIQCILFDHENRVRTAARVQTDGALL